LRVGLSDHRRFSEVDVEAPTGTLQQWGCGVEVDFGASEGAVPEVG